MLVIDDIPSVEASDEIGISFRRLLVAMAIAVLIGVTPFLSGLVGSLILCAITRPSYARLARLIPPRIAAMGVTIGVFLLLLLPGWWLVTTIVGEGRDAVAGWRPNDALTWLSHTPFGGPDVAKELAAAGTTVIAWLSSRAFALVGGVTSTVLNVVIALFGLYYLLLDADQLWVRAKRFLPVSERIADLLATRFSDVTTALLLGTVLTAALQGTLVGVGFSLVGLRPAVLWGFVTACVSVLPLFGSALVWAPGVGILLLNHRPGAALFLLVLGGGIASNLDNLIRPLVYRRVSGIHPLVTLLGAFAGVRLFGLIGAFIGPLVLSYFIELLGIYESATFAVVAGDTRTPARQASRRS